MKLKPLAVGLAGGIICGAVIMVATWWLMIKGSPGGTIGLLGKFYLGYSLSFLGSIVGLVWGFIDGLIGGYLFALLYNLFVKE